MQPTADFDPKAAAKKLMREARSGALATLMAGSGDPYCSLVNVAAATDGAPLLLISRLALHTKNILADARVSLMLDERKEGDPLQGARVMLMGAAAKTGDADARRRYLAYQPEAEMFAGFGDFAFYEIKLQGAHLVAGFGRIVDLKPDDLLTDLTGAEALIAAAVERFGRIDVLVNNAGNFYAGFFEELTPEQIERSLTTNLVGPMNVTRAVLPVMRKQRSGNVVTITSTAGIVGQEFCSAYASAKFGVEGWMESLRFEVEPFGIHTTIVEPGFFRTELLEKESTAYADASIDDYAERTAQTRPAWEAMSGKQGGDPAKLAKALVTVVEQEQPPLRWVAGADAVETVEQKANDLLAQVDAYRDLSSSLALDEAQAGSGDVGGRHMTLM